MEVVSSVSQAVGDAMTKVYLAGPINGQADADVFAWRAAAKSMLSRFDIIDPADRDYRGRELDDGVPEEIVLSDIAALGQADVLLASCHKPSAGTSMEIMHYYRSHRGRVVVVSPDGRPSPWVVVHSHAVVRTLEEACALIVQWHRT